MLCFSNIYKVKNCMCIVCMLMVLRLHEMIWIRDDCSKRNYQQSLRWSTLGNSNFLGNWDNLLKAKHFHLSSEVCARSFAWNKKITWMQTYKCSHWVKSHDKIWGGKCQNRQRSVSKISEKINWLDTYQATFGICNHCA